MLLVTGAGCGKGTDTPSGAAGAAGASTSGPCRTGDTVVCQCPDGVYSVQECRADGSLGPCECGLDPLAPGAVRDAGAEASGADADAGDPSASDPGTQVLLLPSNDILADPTRNLLYLSVGPSAAEHPNSLTAIAADTGQVAWAVALDAEPGPLGIADDGSLLYVGFLSKPTVRRIDLGTQKTDIDLALGKDQSTGEDRVPVDIEVAPGAPHTSVVGCHKGTGYYFSTVAVFDDAVMRPAVLPYYATADVLVIANATTVYGFETGSTGARFSTLTVSASGIAQTSFKDGVFEEFTRNISYGGGLVYGWDGRVYDPGKGAGVGLLDLKGPVLPAGPGGKTIVARGSTGFDVDPVKIGLFDAASYARVTTHDLRSLGGTRRAARAADGTLGLIVDGIPPGRAAQVFVLLVHPAAL